MKLPNFLVAGFPKCGSTSLHYYFSEHPEIFMPAQKELHFFTYDVLQQQNKGKDDKEVKKFHIGTLKEYKACYARASKEIAVGDASPSYANYESAIPKIKEVLGEDVKIIIVLRDPIKRAYSNYLHLVREGRETLSFYDALMKEEERRANNYSDFWYYTFNSLYADKIERMTKEFNNVRLITFEDFIRNPQDNIRDIYDYLGVNPDFSPDNIKTHFNPGGVYKKNPITSFIFKQSKFKSAVKRIVPLNTSVKRAKIQLIKRFQEETPQIDEKSEKYLVEVFKEDVMRLSEFGVKTDLWNKSFINN